MPLQIATELDIRADPRQLQQIMQMLREIEQQQRRIQQMGVQAPPAIGAQMQAQRGAVQTAAPQVMPSRPIGPEPQEALGAIQRQARQTMMPPRLEQRMPEEMQEGFLRPFLRGLGVRERQTIAFAAGFLAQQMISNITEATARALYGGMAAEAGAMVTGTPFGIARGVLARETIQRMAGIQAGVGAAQALGGGLFMAAGTQMMVGNLPGAIGLAIAGLGANIATSLGSMFAQQRVETIMRLRQEAVTGLEEMFTARRGQISAFMQLFRAGIPMGGPGDLTQQIRAAGPRAGLGFGEALQVYAATVQAGGLPIAPEQVFGLMLGFGVQGGQIAQLTRAFRPGYGFAYGPMTPLQLVNTMEATMRDAVETGLRAGIAQTDIPRWLERIAQFNQEMASRGIMIAPDSFTRLANIGIQAGLRGRVVEEIPGRVRGVGLEFAERLGELFMPRDFARDIGFYTMLQRTGWRGTPEDTMRVMRLLEEQPATVWEFIQQGANVLPGGMRGLFMRQMLGLGTGAAQALAQAPQGPVVEPRREQALWPILDEVVERFRALGDEVVSAAQAMAETSVIRETAMSFREAADTAALFTEAVQQATIVVQTLASEEVRRGIERMRRELARLVEGARR